MTDTRRRQLARSAAQGDLDARVRLLLERVRAGELPLERVRLAAWLGDARALAVVGAGSVRPEPEDISAWLLELAGHGSREAVVRALVLSGLALRARAEGGPPEELAATEVFRRWAEHPVGDAALAKEGKRMASRSARRAGGRLPLLLCAWAVELAGSEADSWVDLARKMLTEWARLTGDDDPRPGMREALLPWALGVGVLPRP